jgi:hypothetical protein
MVARLREIDLFQSCLQAMDGSLAVFSSKRGIGCCISLRTADSSALACERVTLAIAAEQSGRNDRLSADADHASGTPATPKPAEILSAASDTSGLRLEKMARQSADFACGSITGASTFARVRI